MENTDYSNPQETIKVKAFGNSGHILVNKRYVGQELVVLDPDTANRIEKIGYRKELEEFALYFVGLVTKVIKEEIAKLKPLPLEPISASEL